MLLSFTARTPTASAVVVQASESESKPHAAAIAQESTL
jgi:hypothetical protein